MGLYFQACESSLDRPEVTKYPRKRGYVNPTRGSCLTPLIGLFRLDQPTNNESVTMQQYNLYEAKTHLSQLVQAALDGEDVLIARAGKPVVRLVPVEVSKPATGGFGCITLPPGALDVAFSPKTEAEVESLFSGEETA